MDVEEIIFEKIQNVTLDFLEPFYPTIPYKMESAIMVLHDWNRQTAFLVLKNKKRAVFYGVTVPFGAGLDKDQSLEDVLNIDLTARHLEAPERTINDLLEGVEAESIEDLPALRPMKEETDKEFYERNALWLLNPPIH